MPGTAALLRRVRDPACPGAAFMAILIRRSPPDVFVLGPTREKRPYLWEESDGVSRPLGIVVTRTGHAAAVRGGGPDREMEEGRRRANHGFWY